MDKEKKLKNFTIGLDSDVEAVSFVNMPAVESNFIFFSEQKPIFLEKEDKHMVYGVALRADFPIYRRFDNNEFYVTFTRECIEQLSQKFLKNGFQKNWTTEHQDIANGISVVESWLKVDMEKDKSIALGLDPNIELGSWIIGCKVDNEEVWEKVKDGTFQGFSVEAMVSLDENNFSKTKIDNMINVEMDEEGLLAKIKNIILEALGKSEDEPKVEVVEDAAIEVVEEAKEELVETPTEEVVEAEVEDTPIEETPIVEDIVEEVIETVEEVAVTEPEVENELQAVVDELQAKIDALNAQVEELKQENQKLSKQPSAKPVNVHNGTSGWDMLREIRNSRYGK